MSEDDVRRVGEGIKKIVKAHKTKQKAQGKSRK